MRKIMWILAMGMLAAAIPVHATEFNGSTILRVNDHEYQIPDVIGEFLMNNYDVIKDTIENVDHDHVS